MATHGQNCESTEYHETKPDTQKNEHKQITTFEATGKDRKEKVLQNQTITHIKQRKE